MRNSPFERCRRLRGTAHVTHCCRICWARPTQERKKDLKPKLKGKKDLKPNLKKDLRPCVKGALARKAPPRPGQPTRLFRALMRSPRTVQHRQPAGLGQRTCAHGWERKG
jgi:hypothetical protein